MFYKSITNLTTIYPILLAHEIFINQEPEIVLKEDSLFSDNPNRLIQFGLSRQIEIEDIEIKQFGTTIYEDKAYVNPKGERCYFSVKQILTSSDDDNQIIQLGKLGMISINELLIGHLKKIEHETVFKEIMKVKMDEVFANREFEEMRSLFFDDGFYNNMKSTSIDDIKDSINKCIYDVLRNNTYLPNLFIKIFDKYFDETCESILLVYDNNKIDKKEEFKQIVANCISENLIIDPLISFNSNMFFFKDDLSSNKDVLKNINQKICDKFMGPGISYLPKLEFRKREEFRESINIIGIQVNNLHSVNNNDLISVLDTKSLLQKIRDTLNSCYTSIISNIETLAEFNLGVKDMKNTFDIKNALVSNVRFINTLQKKENNVVINEYIKISENLIKLSKPFNEQTRIFNILNRGCTAFQINGIYKNNNGKLQSVASKYYTMNKNKLEEVSESPHKFSSTKEEYTGILSKPWFYISILVSLVIIRGILLIILQYRSSRNL